MFTLSTLLPLSVFTAFSLLVGYFGLKHSKSKWRLIGDEDKSYLTQTLHYIGYSLLGVLIALVFFINLVILMIFLA